MRQSSRSRMPGSLRPRVPRCLRVLSGVPSLVAVAALAAACSVARPGREPVTLTESDMLKGARHAHGLEGEWTMFMSAEGVTTHSNIPLILRAAGTHLLGRFGADDGSIDGEL